MFNYRIYPPLLLSGNYQGEMLSDIDYSIKNMYYGCVWVVYYEGKSDIINQIYRIFRGAQDFTFLGTLYSLLTN